MHITVMGFTIKSVKLHDDACIQIVATLHFMIVVRF